MSAPSSVAHLSPSLIVNILLLFLKMSLIGRPFPRDLCTHANLPEKSNIANRSKLHYKLYMNVHMKFSDKRKDANCKQWMKWKWALTNSFPIGRQFLDWVTVTVTVCYSIGAHEGTIDFKSLKKIVLFTNASAYLSFIKLFSLYFIIFDIKWL